MIEHLLALIWIIVKVVAIVLPLLICVAFLTLAERKVIAFMQYRVGPNQICWGGLLQPFADALKLINKELLIPTNSNKYIFITAPILAMVPSLLAWAVIPFGPGVVLADLNAGVLYVLAVTSITAYGVVLAGWSSNSNYALLGAMRSAAQMISYEIAMGFALVAVLMLAGTMNISKIVAYQSGGMLHWLFIPLLPIFVVYCISAIAETNRAPFDVAEGESEIVAGFHVEYSGMGFALFFLAEYANMILVCCLASLLFLGGWESPLAGIKLFAGFNNFIPAFFWLSLKTGILLFGMLWARATFPRYRYDQVMSIGWKWLIPVALAWIGVIAVLMYLKIV